MPTKSAKKSKEELVRQIIALTAERGWENLTLYDMAGHLKMSLAQLHEHFEDKTDILVTFGRMIDRKVLENTGEADPDISPRDQLFDILMERYEALNEYRAGLVSVLCSFRLDPKQAVISMPHLCRSMTWMIEAAGMDTNGISGAMKVTGVTGIYLKVLRIWKDDDSPDLGKTMAALDKALGRAERLANTLGF